MTKRSDLSNLVNIEKWVPIRGDTLHAVYGKIELPSDKVFIGIDPGVNFGMTIMAVNQAIICYGKLPKQEKAWNHGIDAIEFIRRNILYYPWPMAYAVIEGASYGDRFRQVELESVRFGFYKGLLDQNVIAEICPPLTVRMGALGSGKSAAFDRWPLLNHNAADSLGCALYALALFGSS